jgi:hypothetical protein
MHVHGGGGYGVLASGWLQARDVGPGVRAFDWAIDNKYYTAAVEVVLLNLREAGKEAAMAVASESEANITALIAVVDGAVAAPCSAVEWWIDAAVEQHDSEIRLLVDLDPEVSANPWVLLVGTAG